MLTYVLARYQVVGPLLAFLMSGNLMEEWEESWTEQQLEAKDILGLVPWENVMMCMAWSWKSGRSNRRMKTQLHIRRKARLVWGVFSLHTFYETWENCEFMYDI